MCYIQSMTGIQIFMTVAASICMLIGLIGCIIPGLPGTPLGWIGLLLAYFIPQNSVSLVTVIICAVVTVAVEVLNNFVPSIFAKKAGGSKESTIGSTVGVFVGLFSGQVWGIFLGPFLGAFIGELIHDNSDVNKALKSAVWSFLGFITGSGLKLITVSVFLVLFIRGWIK